MSDVDLDVLCDYLRKHGNIPAAREAHKKEKGFDRNINSWLKALKILVERKT